MLSAVRPVLQMVKDIGPNSQDYAQRCRKLGNVTEEKGFLCWMFGRKPDKQAQ